MRHARTRTTAAVGAAILVAGGAGLVSAPTFPDRAAIEVDEPTALSDERVRTRITGLPQWETVTVSATAEGVKETWRSKAAFRANGRGVIDLAKDRPTNGSYRKADEMGLF